MEIVVRPIGFSVKEQTSSEGILVRTFEFEDSGGTVVRVGGFGPEQWERVQAIVADPAAAIARAQTEAAAADARAKIVKP